MERDAETLSKSANRQEQLELPFDQHQRYKVVAEVLETLSEDSTPLRILDVGGGDGVILSFLPNEDVVILDQIEAEELPGFVKGDATALPFEDESFDYVTSIDVYEHIEPEFRGKYLSELRRVARKGVLLAAPFDSEGVRGAEELANEVHRVVHGQGNVWLKEHTENSLPDLNEAREFFDKHQDYITMLPNGYLPNWLAMISLTFYSSMLRDEMQELFERLNTFYNEFMYRYDNVEPCYRYLLVSLKEDREIGVEHVASRTDHSHNALMLAFSSMFSATLPLASRLRTLEGQLAQKDEQLAQKDKQLAQKDGRLAQKEVQVRDFSRRLARQAVEEHENERLTALLRSQRERLEGLKQQKERIEASRSWRLLAFLAKQKRRVMAPFAKSRG